MIKGKTEQIFLSVLCKCLKNSVDSRDNLRKALYSQIPLDVLDEFSNENEIKLNKGATFMDALNEVIKKNKTHERNRTHNAQN